jgi:Predicted Rossmann fold nucleotide-binding protein involved in DNA uptake
MKYSENAINILVTKSFKGVGSAWIIRNRVWEKSIFEIISILKMDTQYTRQIDVDTFEKLKGTLIQKLNDVKGFNIGLTAIGDPEFPRIRGSVKKSEQPVFLYYRGDLSLLKDTNRNVSVIGLLTPDREIELIEREVVSELVKCGVTIVSGLALGCDTIAHKQVLDSNGKTIAILPSPVNRILPKVNSELADKIVRKGGLLISEYFEIASDKFELLRRYKARDRLQAMYSDCIILTASYSRNNLGNDSGSRIAMQYALKYSIQRAVIYDQSENLNNPKYGLNKQLTSDQSDITIINRSNLADSIKKILE